MNLGPQKEYKRDIFGPTTGIRKGQNAGKSNYLGILAKVRPLRHLAQRAGKERASSRGVGVPACRVGILADMRRLPGSGSRLAPPYARKNAGAAA
jgi:hypothetical protein